MTLPDRLLDAVRAACGEGGTIEEPERLRTYECDGLTGHRAIPALVCLPPTAEAVQAVAEWFGPTEELWRAAGVIGPRMPVPDDADEQTRMLAMFGRAA